MAEEALVESQLADATELVKKLDAAGYQPSLAAWYFYDDADEWRLVLAGPGFDNLLPNQEPVAYRKVAEALAQTNASSLSMSDVKLVGSQSSLPKTIRFLISTPKNGLARARFTSNFINGIFIKEMFVLRAA
jgi:hypothetical protein